MDMQSIAILAGALVALVFPITESLKNQMKNIKAKNYQGVLFFVVGVAVTTATAFVLKGSQIADFKELQSLNTVDTTILGLYAGLAITGGKDLISNLQKGKALGDNLKAELSKLSADEVSELAFDILVDKKVVFSEDVENPEDDGHSVMDFTDNPDIELVEDVGEVL